MRAPYYEHGGVTIFHGDSREILPELARHRPACRAEAVMRWRWTKEMLRRAERVGWDHREIEGEIRFLVNQLLAYGEQGAIIALLYCLERQRNIDRGAPPRGVNGLRLLGLDDRRRLQRAIRRRKSEARS